MTTFVFILFFDSSHIQFAIYSMIYTAMDAGEKRGDDLQCLVDTVYLQYPLANVSTSAGGKSASECRRSGRMCTKILQDLNFCLSTKSIAEKETKLAAIFPVCVDSRCWLHRDSALPVSV